MKGLREIGRKSRVEQTLVNVVQRASSSSAIEKETPLASLLVLA